MASDLQGKGAKAPGNSSANVAGVVLSAISFGLSIAICIYFVSSTARAGSWKGAAIYVGAYIVLPMLVALAAGALWRNLVRARERNVARRNPSALVFGSARMNQLQTALDRLSAPLVKAHLPAGFSVSVDDSGVVAWGGAIRNPKSILRLPWSAVRDVRAGTTAGMTRSSSAVIFSVQSDEDSSPIEVGFPAIGRGIGWMFPLSESETEKLAAAVLEKAPSAIRDKLHRR